ncbi:hypothetical protein HID58_048546, partial [Brassica napus]
HFYPATTLHRFDPDHLTVVSSQNTLHQKKKKKEEIGNMKLDLTKEVAKMTLDLKEEITKMRLDMGQQFQHLIASINRLKEGFKSFRERLKESRCDHSFEKRRKREHTTGLVKKPQRYYPGAVIVLETTREIELSTEGEKKPSRFCSRMVSICGIFTIQKSKGLPIASTQAPDEDFKDPEIAEQLRRSREQPVIRRDRCIRKRTR